MEKRDREALEGAYRMAQREVNVAHDAEFVRVQQEIMAKTLVNPRIGWSRVTEAVKGGLNLAIERLITAHLQAGERDEAKISDRLKAFVEAQPVRRGPYVRGASPGYEAREHTMAEANFEAMRASVSGAINDRVAVTLLQHRSTSTRLDRLQRWTGNNRGLVLIVALVATLLFVRGIVQAVADVVQIVRPPTNASPNHL